MSIGNWVRLYLAENNGLPGQRRLRCPSCNGGRSRELSLVLTVDDEQEAKWMCHRASCGVRGSTEVPVTRVPQLGDERKRTAIKPYMRDMTRVTPEDATYFAQRFDIGAHAANVYIRRGEGGAYVLPIFNRFGRIRGHVERQAVWKGEPRPPIEGNENMPKARTWPMLDEPMQSWYYPQTANEPKTVVIVEDQISAIRVSEYGYIGLALLGVHLNGDKAREIQKEAPERTILALDNDAEGQAIKLAQKWAVALPGFEIALLKADLKDVHDPLDELGV